MPVFLLTDELIFPSPELANKDGLLAVGGDLSPERLLLAYRNGIFPWYSEKEPVLWWSPHPRLTLYPHELKISRSLARIIRQNRFSVSMDTAFPQVIRECAGMRRRKEEGTWLVDEMIDAYINLHEYGYAHSVETWKQGRLVGGLYGIALGRCFFGESKFTLVSNASKVAFVALVEWLKQRDFVMIDCQVTTAHLVSFGAREISRSTFLAQLHEALRIPTIRGRWCVETETIADRNQVLQQKGNRADDTL